MSIKSIGMYGAPDPHRASHAAGGTDALSPADIGAATSAQGAKADAALQLPAVSAIAIVDGAISTPLDGGAYRLTLSADVAAGWTAPLPSGADAAAHIYWCSLDILPPTSGGPFALSIPAAWLSLGPLDTITLAVGDDPIAVTLRSWGASGIAYSAIQSSLPA